MTSIIVACKKHGDEYYGPFYTMEGKYFACARLIRSNTQDGMYSEEEIDRADKMDSWDFLVSRAHFEYENVYLATLL